MRLVLVVLVGSGMLVTVGAGPAPAGSCAYAQTRQFVGIAPAAVARAIAFAVEQPDDVEIGELTIRPTSQS